MKIAEAWSAGVTILLAGLLPRPEVAVASITIASDLYTVLATISMPLLHLVCAQAGAVSD